MKIAVLVRIFPNVLQTYILNHILSIRNSQDTARIIAEIKPGLDIVPPTASEQGLLDQTTYINITLGNLLKEVFSTHWFSPRYYALLPRLTGCLRHPGMGPAYFIKALFRVRAMLQDDFDIVHSHSLFSSHQYLFLKTCFNIPLITTFHGLVPSNVKMLERNRIRAVLDAGDIFIVNTRSARELLLEMGCREERIRIIPQATDSEYFQFKDHSISPHEPLRLLTVGRLSPEKGHAIVIEALAMLLASHPGTEYHIVGQGDHEDKLRRMVEARGLQQQVIFHGLKTGQDLKDMYDNAHIFILPSLGSSSGQPAETQGVVLQEAQSSGVPVIASTTGGIPEIIQDGVTGLLFEDGHADQLVARIRSLAEDAQQYSMLAREGRKDVEQNFGVDSIYQRIRKEYEHALSKKYGTR